MVSRIQAGICCIPPALSMQTSSTMSLDQGLVLSGAVHVLREDGAVGGGGR
jgi:hypothetical protein